MTSKGKRKADDNLTGTRHPAARRDPTTGDDLAGTSANTAGRTANAAGDGIAGTSQALAGLTAATTGSAGGSSQFGGAARGAGGGSGYRGFSQPQPHRRAPSQGMLRPPLGNPAVGSAPFPYQYHAPTGNGSLSGQSQISGPRQTGTGQLRGHSLGMLRPPLGNPAGGRPPFTYQYHALTGHCSLPGQNQIAGPLHPGTGQPRGHSGSGGPSWAISCASVEVCPCCKKPPPVVFGGVAPLCVDCYTKIVISDVLEKHPEIRYVHPPPGAAAIRPSSSSSSSSAVGWGPICPACDHPLGTGNRACRFCHINGPPPPGLG
ncbi:collagen alpha-2(I) chain [Triticum aestivum]|uniref:collagen alpha-2(I) chain n=1 Tax=Triticum aestivum TaxID=4565 RepID=UPI001D01E643|nr:collagen alpha-2(I) chain-like [Triticum aestivum]